MSEWREISSAPKDGTEIKLRVEHGNLKHCPPADRHLWTAEVLGKWIEHNGGGWTWHGMSGTPKAWMPLPQPPKETNQ